MIGRLNFNEAPFSHCGGNDGCPAFCLLGGLGLFSDRGMRDPRLVSYDALPPDDTEECTNPVASSGFSLIAGELPLRTILMQARVAAGSNPLDASQRKPERMIRDPYAAYSAVAVDPSNNEVVLTDENLFKIWVYDRSAKTSPNQSTEPKRIIGGLNTKIEFQCGLYIDPSNGDIYAVNNDTIDTLVVFSRERAQARTWCARIAN